jgi:hypothetical protein
VAVVTALLPSSFILATLHTQLNLRTFMIIFLVSTDVRTFWNVTSLSNETIDDPAALDS